MKHLKLLSLILVVMVGLLFIPIKANAEVSYPEVRHTSKYTDDEGKEVYTYNLKLNITDSTEINHLEGRLILTNLEVVNFSSEFSYEFDDTKAYSITSNHYFTAKDSGFTFATVIAKQINEGEDCKLDLEQTSEAKLNVNEFKITKEAYKNGEVITKIKPNEEFQYKITVSSLENVTDSDEVIVTDIVPSDLEIISVDNDGEVKGNTITWNLGSFPAYKTESKTLTINVKASEASTVILKNTASLNVGTKKIEANNEVTINDTDISITKMVSQDKISAGTQFSYTIEVVNSGKSKASGIKVEDIIDSNLGIVNISDGGVMSGNTVVWNFDLDGNSKKELTVTVKAMNNINNGSIRNNAILTFDDKKIESNVIEVIVSEPSDVILPNDDSNNDPKLPPNPNTGTKANLILIGSVGLISSLIYKNTKHKNKIYKLK